MFQEKIAYAGLIQIEMISPHQTYHIISVLYNPSAVAVLDRMALKRQQVPQRNDFGALRRCGSGHGLGRSSALGGSNCKNVGPSR
jgi:hypothetical protein